MVDSSEQVTAHAEEIEDEALDREKSLRVRGGLEPAHLSLALSGRLMRDFLLPPRNPTPKNPALGRGRSRNCCRRREMRPFR